MSGTPEASGGQDTGSGVVMGFDFGTRKIGVAIGNTVTRTARPLRTLHEEASQPRFAALAALIEEWQPVLLVVGRPVHADGTEHTLTRQADRFARRLRERFRLPVEAADERYTTQVAESVRRGGRAAGNPPDRDAVAAQIILQSWFDSMSSPAP